LEDCIGGYFRNTCTTATGTAKSFRLQILQGENEIMKTTKLLMLVMTIAVALFILIPNLSWAADDGATIYKAKCAMCHGADAAGKPAAKIPSLVSDDSKKASDDELAKDITEKAKHPGTVKSLPPDQIKMVVSYIRSLQK
jgi:cytochrome c553